MVITPKDDTKILWDAIARLEDEKRELTAKLEGMNGVDVYYFAECCLRMIPYNKSPMTDEEISECEAKALAVLKGRCV